MCNKMPLCCWSLFVSAPWTHECIIISLARHNALTPGFSPPPPPRLHLYVRLFALLYNNPGVWRRRYWTYRLMVERWILLQERFWNIPVDIIMLNRPNQGRSEADDAAVTGGGKKKKKNFFTRSKVSTVCFFFRFPSRNFTATFLLVLSFFCFFSFVPSSQSVSVFCLFLRWHNPRDVEQQKSKWLQLLSAYQCVNSPRFSLVTYLRSTLKVKTNQAIRITTAPTFTLFFFFFWSAFATSYADTNFALKWQRLAFRQPAAVHSFMFASRVCGKFLVFCIIAFKYSTSTPADLPPSWSPVSTLTCCTCGCL